MATYSRPGTIHAKKAKLAASNKVGLSSPWVSYFKEVYNVFRHDEQVIVDKEITEEGNGVYSFKIVSGNIEKVAALKKILKTEIPFGNITLRIDIDFIAADDEEVTAEDWQAAFDGNPYFKQIVEEPTPASTKAFAVFDRKILTYFNDDISDYCCNRHIIVADAVRDIVKDAGNVSPCTEAAAE